MLGNAGIQKGNLLRCHTGGIESRFLDSGSGLCRNHKTVRLESMLRGWGINLSQAAGDMSTLNADTMLLLRLKATAAQHRTMGRGFQYGPI